ncbi:hypothetical protein LX87_04082 [Larkinella arboricola]|uniref:Uncharacterized protein n=1 Tax=Larkinella arboricola TaxID=643671 RepID=A0A327WSG3_LARAB|nr:hypothetical protein [Larkinella arboricola]RAJ94197.1 hypothetical protein LX87_04082 [Larkinella arboricola]
MTEEFFDQFEEAAIELAQEGILWFQRAIEQKGLVLTEELRRDFNYRLIRTTHQLVIEYDFRQYGRFKDMARLRYGTHMPPVEAMMEYVERHDLNVFAYVEGYPGKQVPTVKNATARIAWAIAMGRRRVPSVARGYRGTWYNSTKMDIFNHAKKRVRAMASGFVIANLKKQLEAGNN